MTNNPNTDSVDAELREQIQKLVGEPIVTLDTLPPNHTHKSPITDQILQLLTQARKEPGIASDTRLTEDEALETILRSVRDAGALDDNFGGEDWSHSEQVIRNAKAQIQARKGYESEQKQREYKEFCRGGRQFLSSALAHANLAKELGTGADLESVVRSMIAMFDDMGVPKSDPGKLFTQAETDQKVAEAERKARLHFVNQMLGNEDWNIPSEVPDRPLLTDRLLEILEDEASELEAQSNPHTPPQEQGPTLQNTHSFNTYGKCTKCGRLRPETAINEVCTPQEQK